MDHREWRILIGPREHEEPSQPIARSAFARTVAPGGKIVPPEVAGEIAAGEQIRIVVMWDPDSTEGPRGTATGHDFQATYAPEDAVHEQLRFE